MGSDPSNFKRGKILITNVFYWLNPIGEKS